MYRIFMPGDSRFPFPFLPAESPWGLPVVADGPASLAKDVMAELASLKLEKKPWPGGSHSLRYHYLALSEPGPGLPHFLAVGYVDDHPFIRYDSRVGRAEPQAPWIAPLDAQYWETETQKQRAWAEVQQVEMWTVMGYYNQSGGRHSAQRMFGCNMQEDGRSSSFWQFGFDGQDHLSLDLETLSWVSAEPMAVRTKRWWESERCYAEYDKAYLEGLCLASLRRYLELGGPSLTRREPPTVQVTRHVIQGRGVTLRCWALGFYPQDISLSWWLGEEELTLETETALQSRIHCHGYLPHPVLAGGWSCDPDQEVPSRWRGTPIIPKAQREQGQLSFPLARSSHTKEVFWGVFGGLEAPCTAGWQM
ncbi:PREDICTED: H-2 class I histocompatibility antigen, Q7 alpha chain-like isoform X4 [Miniopterus natalensis]|uniref:H-2 class I histocompatibility antigen, Q7 alpha chain-like isoform X4 n=1 Tax=Miniopterus natalensis TaxID=291302 RepID=UPI0007A6CDCA|nr:PREDICTED: H-2 class I histocompatibility antigen, Q7 alpha chain-like isoform X4 [Miniopterus natalensis]